MRDEVYLLRRLASLKELKRCAANRLTLACMTERIDEVERMLELK